VTLPGLPLQPGGDDGVLVEVWVVPGSSRSQVGGFHGGALRVRVAAPAEGGKANRAAAALVAEALGGRRGEVVAGHRGRRKRVLVEGVTLEAARARLEEPSGTGPAAG
jgi:uncharacterized protein (TIGR00251 family)